MPPDKPDAVPVVFWFRVGKVQLVNVPDEGVPKAPPDCKAATQVPSLRKNEDLIKEMKALTSENFKTFTKQAQLLVDVAENKDVASITAIEEYLATFHFNIDEEFSNQNTESNGIN